MELSIAFQTDKAITAYGTLAAKAEAYGFDGVTVYNDLLYQPAWLPLLEMARATQRVRLGPAAISPFTRHPLNIAGNIALLDEAAQGRAYLGLARGAWLDFIGVEVKRPVRVMREAFECVRHLLERSTEPYRGEIFPLAGGDTLRWKVYRAEVPFLLGAWGEATMRACLPLVSEIKIGGTANPAMVKRTRDLLDAEGAHSGRAPESVGIVAGAVCVVDQDGTAARQLAKRAVALYLPVVAELDPTLAIEPERLERIKARAAEYDFKGAAELIPDALLNKIAFAGTPDEVAEQAAALFAAGAARVEFGTPHGVTTEEGMRLLGEKVLAALAQ